MDLHFQRYNIYSLFHQFSCLRQCYSQFVRSWDGGSEAFISTSSTSWMLSYTSIENHLNIRAPVNNHTYDLQGHMGDSSLTFKDLLVDFLKGMGIPCPGLFTQAQVYFNMDVGLVDKEYYWSRIFCCATTGSYDLESSDTMISVCIFSHQLVSLQLSILRWNGLMIILCCIGLGLGFQAMS